MDGSLLLGVELLPLVPAARRYEAPPLLERLSVAAAVWMLSARELMVL
jgi:hypothetical protein